MGQPRSTQRYIRKINDDEEQLADDYARMLFRMSSPLPPEMVEQAETIGIPISPGAKGFVFNADMVSMVNFLDIGTRIRTGG